MSGIGLAPVNAFTAHREWAHRPPDERYNSVPDLLNAAYVRRGRTSEYVTDAHHHLHVEPTQDGALQLVDATRRPAALTHWSFGQLTAIAGAPADYLRSLPPTIAAEALNYGLTHSARERHQVYVHRGASRTALAVTSPQYARVHHDDIIRRALDLMERRPQWHLPLAYKNGKWGAERVPSGAYLGVHDMFLFLVDGNRDLDDPTARDGGLFRGFILRNSDVGAAALSLDLFLFRRVCANHIIWGFQHVASFRRRHVGSAIQEAWSASLAAVARALDADTSVDRTLLKRAARQELGSTRDAVIDAVAVRVDLPKKQAAQAYDLAEQHEPNPRSIWGFVQGVTRLSQSSAWQDQRFALDRAASRLLTSVN